MRDCSPAEACERVRQDVVGNLMRPLPSGDGAYRYLGRYALILMGLLDDAIREHLDLKRRHGTSEEEVQRLAQEALTPPQQAGRYAPSPQAADSAQAVQGESPVPGSLSGAEHVDEAPPGAPGFSLADHPVMPEPVGHEPFVEPGESATQPAQVVEQSDVVPIPVTESGPSDPEAEVAPPSAFSAADPWLHDEEERAFLGQETTAFSAVDFVDAETSTGAPVDEDVLEETPDFLQETPEHDRLWFEQKPPRPFDFDQ